ALMKEMGLPLSDDPLLGVVSRFDPQKGLDLVAEIAPALSEASVRLCVLGSGSEELESTFQNLANRYPETIAVRIGFDEALAHRIFG
ncbi:hypothetical protein NPN14_24795, partial [Vibrio parahaemolyticus]|uniref:hypothetical protein n=1 Tax=Vibrio parahaemolyticus TaxID=670 RepID=UPI003FA1E245|nr:hypothetical protein [Vibrio parahaemolyticus]